MCTGASLQEKGWRWDPLPISTRGSGGSAWGRGVVRPSGVCWAGGGGGSAGTAATRGATQHSHSVGARSGSIAVTSPRGCGQRPKPPPPPRPHSGRSPRGSVRNVSSAHSFLRLSLGRQTAQVSIGSRRDAVAMWEPGPGGERGRGPPRSGAPGKQLPARPPEAFLGQLPAVLAGRASGTAPERTCQPARRGRHCV